MPWQVKICRTRYGLNHVVDINPLLFQQGKATLIVAARESQVIRLKKLFSRISGVDSTSKNAIWGWWEIEEKMKGKPVVAALDLFRSVNQIIFLDPERVSPEGERTYSQLWNLANRFAHEAGIPPIAA